MPKITFLIPLLVLAASPVAAQDVAESGAEAIPDPATVEVPEITGGREENVVKDGWKHFYFWRADTTFEQAYADFADCYRFLPVPGSSLEVNRFVAWQGPDAQRHVVPYENYQQGLVGVVVYAALGALVDGPLERRATQSRMRRCLEPRGYQRFPVPEETWEKIDDGYSMASIAVKAKLASGPHPDAEPLPEDR
jgi:hypothetical protein